MSDKLAKIHKTLKPGRIILPILLGIGAVTYLVIKDFDSDAIKGLQWSWSSTGWILLVLIVAAARDLCYMWRLRVLTEKAIDWRAVFYVIFLWEFASALVPPMIGGGFAFAILFLTGEKIEMGKSISIVVITSLLDGLFFVLMAPLMILIFSKTQLFSGINPESVVGIAYGQELFVIFWIIYAIILIYKLIFGYAVFINAGLVKGLLIKICTLPMLRRWRQKAAKTGDELIVASMELKHKSTRYWIESILATFATWTARFVIINCIIMAFSNMNIDHFLIFGRQIVMGILMIGSPTPGSSGVAELVFSNFLGEFIPLGLVATLALFWRLIAYYAYLFIGAILLPKWLRKIFGKDLGK